MSFVAYLINPIVLARGRGSCFGRFLFLVSKRLPGLSPGLPNLEKTEKNAVLSSNFEIRAVLHSKRFWTRLGGFLGANLDVLGVHLAAVGTNLGPTWTLSGPTWSLLGPT